MTHHKFRTNTPERPGASLVHIVRVDLLNRIFEGRGGEWAACKRARAAGLSPKLYKWHMQIVALASGHFGWLGSARAIHAGQSYDCDEANATAIISGPGLNQGGNFVEQQPTRGRYLWSSRSYRGTE